MINMLLIYFSVFSLSVFNIAPALYFYVILLLWDVALTMSFSNEDRYKNYPNHFRACQIYIKVFTIENIPFVVPCCQSTKLSFFFLQSESGRLKESVGFVLFWFCGVFTAFLLQYDDDEYVGELRDNCTTYLFIFKLDIEMHYIIFNLFNYIFLYKLSHYIYIINW